MSLTIKTILDKIYTALTAWKCTERPSLADLRERLNKALDEIEGRE